MRGGLNPPLIRGAGKFCKIFVSENHTCDIILDTNREIWASKSYFAF